MILVIRVHLYKQEEIFPVILQKHEKTASNIRYTDS
jgi:hypothetical protein